MTGWEKAVAHWLPEVWGPEAYCEGGTKKQGDKYWTICPHGHMAGHDIRCPPATPELGFRLLEAMLRSGLALDVGMIMGQFFVVEDGDAYGYEDPDLLTAIIKAAAALADKKNG